MIYHDSLLVQLVRLVDRLPAPSTIPRRGRPIVYSDALFLKALVVMIVRRLHKVGELLAVLEEPTQEMRSLRELLSGPEGRFPSRRTFERRLRGLPDTLPEWIGLLGRHPVELLKPWAKTGRAVALDSAVLRAKGGVWHKKDKEAGVVHSSIDTEAGWTKSGWHGWIYGCLAEGRFMVSPRRGAYPHTDYGVEVRRIFHLLRHRAIENLNAHFKALFDAHGSVPTKGEADTARFALGAVLVYQLALLHRHEDAQRRSDTNRGLKAFLRAA